ncbi:hypothetical protein N7520_001985 [Penicillium odoratum]|uniref:uncharacterized protein n=1 Tax=Penicillium odoratum TaxID=1167516 RepID=UPI002548AABB|nr:uncharacterized protein N7520_001985 [Penicillium odoratum]KAJ5778739.1 hypothetical protein N7520_001985 [Penicillium odoratum]
MSLNNPTQPLFQSSVPKEIPQPVSRSQLNGPHPAGAKESQASPQAIDDPRTAAELQDGAPQQPAFQPFFTLIEDIPTAEYHHPTVHYIFSDDDTDIITEAALRSLEAQQDALPGSKKHHTYIGQHDGQEDHDASTLLPPPIPGIRENYVILDVEPVPASEHTTTAPSPAAMQFGPGVNPMSSSPATQPSPGAGTAPQPQFRVTSAKSFSPDWQVMRSEMVPAPTFENNEDGDGTGHGLLLKIHGTGGLPYAAESTKERGTSRLEEMMNQFAKRMSELQTVIDSAYVEGEKRQDGDAEVEAGVDEQEQSHDKTINTEEQPEDEAPEVAQQEQISPKPVPG